jgi:phosphomethylpyrimidine synthase
MKITQEVREHAERQGLTAEEALQAGLDEKAREFRAGGQI